MPATDLELLQRICERETTAFAEFYDRYAPKAYAMILHLLRNQTAAEDVLQETFLQVWTQASRFDSQRCLPEGWLIMLARSRALDQLRKQRETLQSMPDLADKVTQDSVQIAEETAVVGTALQTLPKEQEVPIRLAFYEGLTHSEVAHRLDLPLGTIKTRIRLGMEKLRLNLTSSLER